MHFCYQLENLELFQKYTNSMVFKCDKINKQFHTKFINLFIFHTNLVVVYI